MTKLSILIELLLKHDLKPETKEFIALHIKETEIEVLGKSEQMPIVTSGYLHRPMPGQQAPSTQAAMARHAGLVPGPGYEPPPAPELVAVVAQTPMAVAAMHNREQLIADSIAGKIDKARGSPRKG